MSNDPLAVLQTRKGVSADVKQMIAESRQVVAQVANTTITLLYWRIGMRIHSEILKKKRAAYGKEILATVSRELSREYGGGYSYSNLARMVQFAEAFPDGQIVATLSRQLSWSHFTQLLPLDKPLQREFYAETCRIERWSVRTLRDKIDGMLYERTGISKQPEEMARAELQKLRKGDILSPETVFRDPVFLHFTGLKDRYLEKDLEDAILRELESFLLELGNGFTFMERQYRIPIDGEDFHLDLLFYHRRLGRLVAIDLKLGSFKPAYKAQMELYLRWLEKHEQLPQEGKPLGILLCAGKKKEQIELLELGKSGIHVAEYLTELPSRDLLEKKLHAAIKTSRKLINSKIPELVDKGSKAKPKNAAKKKTLARKNK